MEGAPRADAELVELLNELTFPIRKNFGMFVQIQIAIDSVTRDAVNLRVWTRHERQGDFEMPGILDGHLPSQSILIESIASPARERMRKPFAKAWSRFIRAT